MGAESTEHTIWLVQRRMQSADAIYKLAAAEEANWEPSDWRWDPQACRARQSPVEGPGGAHAVLPQQQQQQQQQQDAPSLPAPAETPTRAEPIHHQPKVATHNTGRSGCQADGCTRSLANLTFYHTRNRICDVHIKSDMFTRDGVELRFCQRCGHPHQLSEFDDKKHSCRAQLEKHNARRRKRQQGDAAAPREKHQQKGGNGRGRKKKSSLDDDEEDDTQAPPPAEPTAPVRRSYRARTANPATAAALEEEEVEPETVQAPVAQYCCTAAPAAPASPAKETAPAESSASQRPPSPVLPLLDFNASDIMAASFLDSGPPSSNNNLSCWLARELADLKEMEHGDVAENADELYSPPVGESLGLLAPTLPEGTSSFDMGAVLMLPLAEEENAHGVPSVLALSTSPKLTKDAMLSTVSVKLFGCTPGELPPDLRSQLTSWFTGHVASLDGYLRPGCVHLTVQAVMAQGEEEVAGAIYPVDQQQPEQVDAGDGAGPSVPSLSIAGSKRQEPEGGGAGRAMQGSLATGGVARLVQRMLASGEPLWRTKTLLVQAGREVALVSGGRLHQVWDISSSANGRPAPSVMEMKPAVLLSSPAAPPATLTTLVVQGINLLQNDYELVSRLQGEYLMVESAGCTECMCSAAVRACCQADGSAEMAASAAGWEAQCCGCCVSKLASLRLDEGERGGSEEQHCCSKAEETRVDDVRPQSLLIRMASPLRPGMLHVDLLMGAYMAPQGGKALVVDSAAEREELLRLPKNQMHAWIEALGVVYEWIGDRSKMEYSVVERVAARLLHDAVGAGLVAVAARLLSLMQGEIMAAAATLPRRQGGGVLDGLAMLSQVDRDCRAATLRRASLLGCMGKLSLLHRAVQSQIPAMLEMVLGWGEEAGVKWRCDAAGPRGLTPLHLAVLAHDPVVAARMALALVASCEPNAAAWKEAVTDDDLTPAAFALRLNRNRLVDAFLPETKLRVAVVASKPDEGLAEAPSTPRCKCIGPCPCAQSAEPCASCAMGGLSEDEEGCCGSQGGTCCCCSSSAAAAAGGSQLPEESKVSYPACCAAKNTGAAAGAAAPKSCCGS